MILFDIIKLSFAPFYWAYCCVVLNIPQKTLMINVHIIEIFLFNVYIIVLEVMTILT